MSPAPQERAEHQVLRLIGRGAAVGTVWQVVRALSHLVWVVIVARLLGPDAYGKLAGAMGLAGALGTFTGLGLGLVMLLEVPRQLHTFGHAWYRALLMTIGSGVFLVALFVFVAPFVIGRAASNQVLIAIGISEIICFPIAVLCSFAFQTHERMGWASAVYAAVPAASTMAAAACWISETQPSLGTYIIYHAVASVATALFLVGVVRIRLRPPRSKFACSRTEALRGMELSIVRTADIALNTLDKTLVLRIGGGEMAGVYAVATRLAFALALPIVTLSSAALPRLSRLKAEPASSRDGLIRRLLAVTIGWGAAAALGMVVLGQVLPVILGPAYIAVAAVASHLAALPALVGLCSLGCTVLLTSDRQRHRLTIQLFGLLVLVGTAVLFIPAYGLSGAATMVLLTQVLTASGLWLIIWTTRSKSVAGS
jgi:O-antigen/teichoic acid export membrane protein